MKNARLPLAAALAILAGCHHARGAGFTCHALEGRPPFTAGSPEGYWIWQDGRGWHLRTTSSDVSHRFHGVVESVDGGVEKVVAVGVRRGVSPGEDAIAFDWESSGSEQGFDWAASDDCARFDLYIDEDARPLRVFLGGGEQSPARVPFEVCR